MILVREYATEAVNAKRFTDLDNQEVFRISIQI